MTYFGINSWLITFVIALEKKLDPVKVWKTSFGWLSLNYFGGASVAFLLVGYNRTINLGYIGAIIPLLLVLYFTFKAAMGRVEDADKHVEQINRLYLSTIETLAMAIDAKDQVTHGHIRRVQAHATSLARKSEYAMKICSRRSKRQPCFTTWANWQFPNTFLNKPGKLTDAEFEKMKLHASVGADILSAIDFPYPVVPIVRHHHENWDGTGYPAGIKGTAIPIGARILAVVDCFDALTSDRPYRPKLSDEEALAILKERRGTMYDPMVVDTFFKFHSTVPADIPRQGPPSDVLNTIARSRRAGPSNNPSASSAAITASADEMLTLYELTRVLETRVSLSDTGDAVAKHLRRLIPSSLCVFYIYDRICDDLEAKYVVGETASRVRGLRIALGQRLSGWVAANRQTILNSDAILDLGDAAAFQSPKLKTCLSTPVIWDKELVGVLTLYSTEIDGFSEDHKRSIEAVSRQIAHTLRNAADFDESPHRDALLALPNVQQLEQFVETRTSRSTVNGLAFSLLFIDLVGLEAINSLHGRPCGDKVLHHVVQCVTTNLRHTDVLFRLGGHEFVVLMTDASASAAEVSGGHIREAIHAFPVPHSVNGPVQLEVMVVAVSWPADGNTLQALMRIARKKIEPRESIRLSHPRST